MTLSENTSSQIAPPLTTEDAMQAAHVHHQAGRLAEAETMYRKVLARQPKNSDALHLLGVLAGQTGRHELGADLIQRAIQINPRVSNYFNNLSLMLHATGRFEQAAAACLKAIQIKGDYVQAHFNLANALREMGDYAGANTSYQKAIALQPGLFVAYNNIGLSLAALGRLDAAAAAFAKAIDINPKYAEAYRNLAILHKEQGQLDQAIAWCDKGMAQRPDDSSLEQERLYLLQFHPAFDAAAIRASQEAWNQRHARPRQQGLRPHLPDHYPERRLRIGYVSPDFRDTPVGHGIYPLLAHHDRKMHEIHCFSGALRPDRMTAEFQKCADRWHTISQLGDKELAELMRKNRIDILVDLTAHALGSRLGAFARKPAPVQITWGPYPAGTGLETLDYRLSDPYLDPPGQNDAHYVEQTLPLENSFWCYDPAALTPGANDQWEPGPLPALAKRRITFGCLNDFWKINTGVLELWAQVLQASPGSELLLAVPTGPARQRTMESLSKRGIVPTRVRFVAVLPRPSYLQYYAQIDLALDTLPCNGQLSSLDALWMGVPVLSLVGQTAVGRATFSHLSNLGLADLCARTPEAYVALTAAVARDLDRMALLRSTLRQRMLESPLTNAQRFAQNVEAAYRQIWRMFCKA